LYFGNLLESSDWAVANDDRPSAEIPISDSQLPSLFMIAIWLIRPAWASFS
jgi:hypothetical protein